MSSGIWAPAPYYSNHAYGSPRSGGAKGAGRDEDAAGRRAATEDGLGGRPPRGPATTTTGLTIEVDDDMGTSERSGQQQQQQQQQHHHHHHHHQHGRHNSEGVSPVMPVPLSSARVHHDRAHRDATMQASPAGGVVLPPSVASTAISAHWNIYKAGAPSPHEEAFYGNEDGTRRHDDQGAGVSPSASPGKRERQSTSGRSSQHHQQQQHHDAGMVRSSRITARGKGASATAAAGRLGMPYHIFQRTARKSDQISVALSQAGQQGAGLASPQEGTTEPGTSNSNTVSAAVVRVAQEGQEEEAQAELEAFPLSDADDKARRRHSRSQQSSHSIRQVYEKQPDGSYVRRIDVSTLAAEDGIALAGSRAVSPLDQSIQTLIRSSSANDDGAGHHHQRGWSATSSGSLRRDRGDSRSGSGSGSKARLTAGGILSPTGSSTTQQQQQQQQQPYGPRNLGSVSCRSSASIVSASMAASAAGVGSGSNQRRRSASASASASASVGSHRRRTGGSSSGFFDKLKEGSLEVLARMGVLTPPSPRNNEPRTISTRTREPQLHALALPPPTISLRPPLPETSKPQPHHARTQSGASVGSAVSSCTAASGVSRSGHGQGQHRPPQTHRHRVTPLSISNSSSMASVVRHPPLPRKAAGGGYGCSSSSSSSSSPSFSSGSDSDDGGAGVPSTEAKECARTALEVIIDRLAQAQAQGGQEAVLYEVRKFVEGGGISALVRGVQTLARDAGLAFQLMYVLRLTVTMDAGARREVASTAKGHILLEHVPAILREHRGALPIVRDGVAVVEALLADPVSADTAATLMVRPETLALVKQVRARLAPGTKDEQLYAAFLERAAKTPAGAGAGAGVTGVVA